MAFRDIEIVCRPVKSCYCQREKIMVNTRSNGESAGDKFTGLREVAKFCEFPRLKTVGDLEAQMFHLWSLAGLLHSEKIMKSLQYLQIKPEDTFLDILPVIQKFEQIVQSVNRQKQSTENASFDKSGSQRKKNFQTAKKAAKCSYFLHFFGNCGRTHERVSCLAFAKRCKKCKKLESFSKTCCVRKHFVEILV